ncbi:MAG: transcription termination/antitermination protein NusA [Oscillospiraceae bacterium]|nr:transcription termination/antitermination protein NusA [Oscillospiraceae bacterium]
MNEGFFEALAALECENSVEQQLLVEKVEAAMLKAMKKAYPYSEEEDFRIEIDPGTHQFALWMQKTAVDGTPNTPYEVSLAEARLIDPNVQDGDSVECRLDPSEFGRSIAQFAKQSIRGDLRAISREQMLQKFESKEDQIISVQVTQVEPGHGPVTVEYDKTELYLSSKEQIPGETLVEGQMIKVYVTGIVNKAKKPVVRISRVDRGLVRRLFELAVPEIHDGVVEIRSIAREAGFRSKIAVCSLDPNVDAVGACIGPHRSRIETVVRELHGEKIDIIPYSEDPEEFITRALAPATVISTTLAEDGVRAATVIVPNQQLSLAIGNKGQNAKLAAKLTGYKIDIRPEYPDPEKVETVPAREADTEE